MTTTRIFNNGNSQAVRLPRKFRFDVDEVEILRWADEIILRKKPANPKAAFDLLTGMPEDFFSEGRTAPCRKNARRFEHGPVPAGHQIYIAKRRPPKS